MQRSKGRTAVRERKVLLAFQKGKFELLVCSFESTFCELQLFVITNFVNK